MKFYAQPSIRIKNVRLKGEKSQKTSRAPLYVKKLEFHLRSKTNLRQFPLQTVPSL